MINIIHKRFSQVPSFEPYFYGIPTPKGQIPSTGNPYPVIIYCPLYIANCTSINCAFPNCALSIVHCQLYTFPTSRIPPLTSHLEVALRRFFRARPTVSREMVGTTFSSISLLAMRDRVHLLWPSGGALRFIARI